MCDEQALARARGGVSGALAGVPVLVKDLIDTAGVRTTYGSSLYADHVPARTAPSVAALEAQGAIVVAKANLDEFAWASRPNTIYGDTVNPTAPDRVAAARAAATPPRWPPAWSRWRSGPIRAARSASPPRRAAWSG